MLSLIVLQGPGKGRVFRFPGDKPVVLGRQSGDLRLLDPKVSRRHAEINFEAGTWVLRDLGSVNGTFVNGQCIDQMTELEEGDQVRFGPFVLVIGHVSNEPPTMEDTSLLDAESMDHVALSPHLPTSSKLADDDDVMHVEPVDHPPRPEAPASASATGDSEQPYESMFNVQVPEDDAADDQSPQPRSEPQPTDEAPAEAAVEPQADAAPPPAAAELAPDAPPVQLLEAQAEPSSEAAPDRWTNGEATDDEPVVETPANLIDSLMRLPFKNGLDDTSAGDVVHENGREEPAHRQPPATLSEGGAPEGQGSRSLWLVLLAALLLLAGAGAGLWWITGRPSVTALMHYPSGVGVPAAAEAALPLPADPEAWNRRTGAHGTTPAGVESPAAPERINTLAMSMFEDGPVVSDTEAPPQPTEPPQSTAIAPPPDEDEAEPAAATPSPPVPVARQTEPVASVQTPRPTSSQPVRRRPLHQADGLDPNHVVFLVDASGSLVDTLPQVLDWLDEQLRQLEPQWRYTVIFFRDGEAVEVPPDGLKDADDQATGRRVRRWIVWDGGNVWPAGRSDPRQAIDRALDYRAGQLFILSDGHVGDRLSEQDVDQFLARLRQRVGGDNLAVHSVQFYYPQMGSMLAKLADRYPGQRRFIGPPQVDDSSGLDLLSAAPN